MSVTLRHLNTIAEALRLCGCVVRACARYNSDNWMSQGYSVHHSIANAIHDIRNAAQQLADETGDQTVLELASLAPYQNFAYVAEVLRSGQQQVPLLEPAFHAALKRLGSQR